MTVEVEVTAVAEGPSADGRVRLAPVGRRRIGLGRRRAAPPSPLDIRGVLPV